MGATSSFGHYPAESRTRTPPPSIPASPSRPHEPAVRTLGATGKRRRRVNLDTAPITAWPEAFQLVRRPPTRKLPPPLRGRAGALKAHRPRHVSGGRHRRYGMYCGNTGTPSPGAGGQLCARSTGQVRAQLRGTQAEGSPRLAPSASPPATETPRHSHSNQTLPPPGGRGGEPRHDQQTVRLRAAMAISRTWMRAEQDFFPDDKVSQGGGGQQSRGLGWPRAPCMRSTHLDQDAARSWRRGPCRGYHRRQVEQKAPVGCASMGPWEVDRPRVDPSLGKGGEEDSAPSPRLTGSLVVSYEAVLVEPGLLGASPPSRAPAARF